MDSEDIKTREQLAQFILQLRNDLLTNPDEWENPLLERYLEALAAYITDIEGYYRNANINMDADTPGWRLFADALWGARNYE